MIVGHLVITDKVLVVGVGQGYVVEEDGVAVVVMEQSVLRSTLAYEEVMSILKRNIVT